MEQLNNLKSNIKNILYNDSVIWHNREFIFDDNNNFLDTIVINLDNGKALRNGTLIIQPIKNYYNSSTGKYYDFWTTGAGNIIQSQQILVEGLVKDINTGNIIQSTSLLLSKEYYYAEEIVLLIKFDFNGTVSSISYSGNKAQILNINSTIYGGYVPDVNNDVIWNRTICDKPITAIRITRQGYLIGDNNNRYGKLSFNKTKFIATLSGKYI